MTETAYRTVVPATTRTVVPATTSPSRSPKHQALLGQDVVELRSSLAQFWYPTGLRLRRLWQASTVKSSGVRNDSTPIRAREVPNVSCPNVAAGCVLPVV